VPNRLATATSPYLLQHADNPVDWREWGEEAFAEARERGVPVLVSVGYAACHWCHVMAHESFEDEATAAQMNAGFVCVKVDREERPDVDSVYMAATQALTGQGGWPMTVFTTPDGAPLYCGPCTVFGHRHCNRHRPRSRALTQRSTTRPVRSNAAAQGARRPHVAGCPPRRLAAPPGARTSARPAT
jgi:hypothetical protein